MLVAETALQGLRLTLILFRGTKSCTIVMASRQNGCRGNVIDWRVVATPRAQVGRNASLLTLCQ